MKRARDKLQKRIALSLAVSLVAVFVLNAALPTLAAGINGQTEQSSVSTEQSSALTDEQEWQDVEFNDYLASQQEEIVEQDLPHIDIEDIVMQSDTQDPDVDVDVDVDQEGDQGESTGSGTEQSPDTTVPVKKEVRSEAELEAAISGVNTSDVIDITITESFEVTKVINFEKATITVTGSTGNEVLTLTSAGKLTVKTGATVSFNNLTVLSQNSNSALDVYLNATVTLNSIVFDGKNTAPQGVDVNRNNSETTTAELIIGADVHFKNHTAQAIRIQKGGKLTVDNNGSVEFENERISIASITKQSDQDNTIELGPEKDQFLDAVEKVETTSSTDGSVTTTENYHKLFVREVNTETDFVKYMNENNVHIKLTGDLTFSETTYTDNKIEVKNNSNIWIDGNNFTVTLKNQNYFYISSAKAVKVTEMTVQGYATNPGLYFINTRGYNAYNITDSQKTTETIPGVQLDGLTMYGNKSEETGESGEQKKATTGIRIVGATVSLNWKNRLSSYKSEGHDVASIVLTGHKDEKLYGATLDIYGELSFKNDNLAVRGIDYESDMTEAGDAYKKLTITDHTKKTTHTGAQRLYFSSGYAQVYDYILQTVVHVNTPKGFLEAVRVRGNHVILDTDITLTELYQESTDYMPGANLGEIFVGAYTTIESKAKEKSDITLDLGTNALIFKQNASEMKNLTVKNGGRKVQDPNTEGRSIKEGIQLYNCRGILFSDIVVVENMGWGILVNGATGTFHNITTQNNNSGGIIITRSRTLFKTHSTQASEIKITGTSVHHETNVHVRVINLQMLVKETRADGEEYVIAKPGDMSINTFNHSGMDEKALKYIKHERAIVNQKMSQFYLDYFKFTGPDTEVTYDSQTIDYVYQRTRLDVTTQQEVRVGWTIEGGNPKGADLISLDNKGVEDITADLETLIAYAGYYSRELYFPAGTYNLENSITLTNLNKREGNENKGQKGLCNFLLKGDENGLAIIKGNDSLAVGFSSKSSEQVDYQYPIHYSGVDGLVFDNVYFELKGPNKVGVFFDNNLFMNGNYEIYNNVTNGNQYVKLNYYIDLENSTYTVTGNAFFRDQQHPGKGVGYFATKDSIITQNYFGNLGNFNNSGNSEGQYIAPKDLLEPATISKIQKAIEEGLLNPDVENGNFFTGINILRRDVNVTIDKNYFDMERTKDVSGLEHTELDIYGLNDKNAPRRRDHIIYAKGHNNLNIVGNYFSGMENGGAGGVKIRDGQNTYVGSNYFDNVPLLTYVYADLSHDEARLENTLVYNNHFQFKDNFGSAHSGILFYPSFTDREVKILAKSALDPVKEEKPVYIDLKNFVMLNNKFSADNRDGITFNHKIDGKYITEIYSAGNTYYDDAPYHKQTFKGQNVISEVKNDGIEIPLKDIATVTAQAESFLAYETYKDIAIPFKEDRDYYYMNQRIAVLNELVLGLKGELSSEYDSFVASVNEFTAKGQSNTQADINLFVGKIEEIIEELKNDKKATKVEMQDIIGAVGKEITPVTATQTGGTRFGTWSAEGLPEGLEINRDTGIVSGTPAVSGIFNVTVTYTTPNAQKTSVQIKAIISTNVNYAIVFPSDITFTSQDQTHDMNVKYVDLSNGTYTDDVTISVKSKNGMQLLDDSSNAVPWTLTYGSINVNGAHTTVIGTLNHQKTLLQGMAQLTGSANTKGVIFRDLLTFTASS